MKIPTCFLDIILILLIYMIILYSPDQKKNEEAAPKSRSEFILNVSWDAKLDADVDTWALRVESPESRTGFNRRENDVFILHNDNTNAEYGMIDGQLLDEARETLTIERIQTGEYVFSLHGYRIAPGEAVTVTVELQKCSPYGHVFKREVQINHNEEVTIASFYIDEDGNVKDLVLDSDLIQGFLKQ